MKQITEFNLFLIKAIYKLYNTRYGEKFDKMHQTVNSAIKKIKFMAIKFQKLKKTKEQEQSDRIYDEMFENQDFLKGIIFDDVAQNIQNSSKDDHQGYSKAELNESINTTKHIDNNADSSDSLHKLIISSDKIANDNLDEA